MEEMPQQQNHSYTPEDRFFSILETNLDKYVNDRTAAYHFITSQLAQYKEGSLTLER